MNNKILCRICLTHSVDHTNMFNIFSKEDKVMISTKLMLIAKIEIYSDDGLPTMICSKCLTLLNNCLDFIDLCRVSDQQLRASLKNKLELTNHQTDTYDSVNSDDDSMKIEQNSTDEGTIYDSKVIAKIPKNIDKKKRGKKQQCSICGRVMSSSYRLKTHLVTHSGTRPYSCPHCGKHFSLPENLKVHLRTHTGEKPLSCLICGESFAQSSGLIAHRRKHTGQLPYQCKLCPRSFRTIGHLQYHTKRHTGEKKFECDTCGRGFITRGDLKQHIATHTGDRSHVCTICGLRLTRASNLKRHIHQLHSRAETTFSNSKTEKDNQKIRNDRFKETEAK
ncbi:zinc finger protein 32-like [Ostrinia furnacalis]|uniref:zinc finger protein 32-like n=1 Tax=Ostrinia furnacalis TaxID=93504 RepID=UPI00103FD2A4|nr:zinc finger protein 32-like [Ostrinia furnacalis]